MKLKQLFLVLIATLLIASELTYSQDLSGPGPKKARTPADYKARTLKEIATMSLEDTRVETGQEVLTGDLLPSHVRVTFRGSRRPLSRARRDVIFHWAQRYAGSPQHYTGSYQTDLLFREDDSNHWLVVKSDLLPRFKREIRKGEAIDLYLIRLGGVRTKGKWEWVLLVESIAKPQFGVR